MGTTHSKNYTLIHDYSLSQTTTSNFDGVQDVPTPTYPFIRIMTPQLRGKSEHVNFAVYASLCPISYYKLGFGAFSKTQ